MKQSTKDELVSDGSGRSGPGPSSLGRSNSRSYITNRYSPDQFAGLKDEHQPDAIKEVIEWA